MKSLIELEIQYERIMRNFYPKLFQYRDLLQPYSKYKSYDFKHWSEEIQYYTDFLEKFYGSSNNLKECGVVKISDKRDFYHKMRHGVNAFKNLHLEFSEEGMAGGDLEFIETYFEATEEEFLPELVSRIDETEIDLALFHSKKTSKAE